MNYVMNLPNKLQLSWFSNVSGVKKLYYGFTKKKHTQLGWFHILSGVTKLLNWGLSLIGFGTLFGPSGRDKYFDSHTA